MHVEYMEHSTLGVAYIMAAANIETDIVLPNLRPVTSETQLQPMEECIKEAKAFVRGEAPGCAVLGRVLSNMLVHYNLKPSDGPWVLCRTGLDLDGIREVLAMGDAAPCTSGGLKRGSLDTDDPTHSAEESAGDPSQTAPASQSSKKRARTLE